jgi:leucyl-tRNA synthetase
MSDVNLNPVAVLVNGKLRATVTLPHDAAPVQWRETALAAPDVIAAMGGKKPRKVIVGANGTVNVVV